MGELLQSSFVEALQQENLNPAGPPRIEPGDLASGNGIEFTAVFDVYPDIEPPATESLIVARPQASVTDEDVHRMLGTLQNQRRSWNEVDRAAALGDQLIIDFEGTVDGKPLEQGRGTEVPIELGVGRMIPGFEDGLVGAESGR